MRASKAVGSRACAASRWRLARTAEDAARGVHGGAPGPAGCLPRGGVADPRNERCTPRQFSYILQVIHGPARGRSGGRCAILLYTSCSTPRRAAGCAAPGRLHVSEDRWRLTTAPRSAPKKRQVTTPRTSPFSRDSRRCASAPACTSGRRAHAACTTLCTRLLITLSTRR